VCRIKGCWRGFSCRRVSVCLSVTSRHCIETARFTQITPNDSPGWFSVTRALPNSDGITPQRSAKYR